MLKVSSWDVLHHKVHGILEDEEKVNSGDRYLRVLFDEQHRVYLDGEDTAMFNNHGVADPVDSEALSGVCGSDRVLEAL